MRNFWARLGPAIALTVLKSRQPRTVCTSPGGRILLGVALALALAPQIARAEEGISSDGPERAVLDISGTSVSNSEDSCVKLENLDNVIVENMTIGPCAKHGILIVDSERVTIRNVTIRGAGEAGIYLLGSQSIDITGNVISDTISAISAVSSTRINVSCNTLEDVRGPIPSGQFVQFNKVTGPDNRISCNVGRNSPGFGRPEDAISTYQSSGTPSSPIMISDNLIVGGGPSKSGGGIMLGDDGGSDIVAHANVLVDPGQYGIAVASGENMSILDNVVYGRKQDFTNVGIYVWNQYPHDCGDVTVRGNQVRWFSKTGAPNPYWDGENCGPVADIEQNNFSAPISPDIADLKAPKCSCPATAGRQ